MTVEATKAKKTTKMKKYYPKDFIFEKNIYMIKNKKPILEPITEHIVHFSGGAVVLKKGVAVSDAELKLISGYQKNHYLVEK